MDKKRYTELYTRACSEVHLDLDDPCDRSIVDVCLPEHDARELLELHDRLFSPFHGCEQFR